jgi:tRNA G46 methylase TrmB
MLPRDARTMLPRQGKKVCENTPCRTGQRIERGSLLLPKEPGPLLQGLPPEAELAARCVRPELDAVCAARVRELAVVVDWRALYRLAPLGSFPALHARLEELSPEALPDEPREILQTHALAGNLQHEFLLEKLFAVGNKLQERGLPALPYLESTFAYCVSRDPRRRPCGWLDFVIRKEDVEAVRRAMLEEGNWEMAERVVNTPDRGWKRGCFFLLNREEEYSARILWSAAPWTRAVHFDLQRARERATVGHIRGQAIPVLAPEDLLMLRCIDSAETLWELSSIADVASLLHAYPDLDWDRLFREARRNGTLRMLLLGLFLAAGLLEQPLPKAMANAAAEDRTLEALARQVRYRVFEPEAQPLRIPEAVRFHLRSRERARDRARNLWRFVSTPTEADLQAVRLPEAWRSLYPVVRAGRLALRLAGLPMEDAWRRAAGKPENLSGFSSTRMAVVDQMLELGEVGPRDVVYDLGCGDGRIVIRAAQRFGARGVGIDIDPERIRESQARAREAGVEDRVTFRLADAIAVDLSEATVVTLYLPLRANLRLAPKLERELRPGARIVSQDADLLKWDKVMGCPHRGYPTVLYRRKI